MGSRLQLPAGILGFRLVPALLGALLVVLGHGRVGARGRHVDLTGIGHVSPVDLGRQALQRQGMLDQRVFDLFAGGVDLLLQLPRCQAQLLSGGPMSARGEVGPCAGQVRVEAIAVRALLSLRRISGC
jgi:hypothetical protein